MTHTKTVLLSAAALICVFLIGLSVYINSNQLKIEFYENAEVSVNEAVDNYQFVKSIENGEILTEKTLIDTASVGEKNIALTVKPVLGAEKVFYYSVLVVDRESPKITFTDHLEAALGDEIDLLAGVIAADNSGEEITVTVEGSYDFKTIGEYKLKYVAVDSSSNRTEEEFVLSVVDRESPKITFADHLETDIGCEIDLLEDVSAVDNSGEEITVTVEGSYDFKTIGEYILKYVAADSSLNRAEEEFVLSVVDRESPKITFTDYLETTKGKKIDLLAGVSATDNSGEKITVTVEGSYNINKAGEYKLKYVAYDSSLNKAEVEFTLKVKEVVVSTPTPTPTPTPPENSETVTFTTSKGFTGVIKNGVTYIDGYLIANKTYTLPQSYGDGLTSETRSSFKKMAAAAKEDGLEIYIVSGFRSYSTQKTLYNNYVKRDGAAAADTYSARAGHSEHQSGLAFDLNSVKNSFANTPEAAWLAENCYKYGFILRYPKGKSNETGYMYEPWHFRYVGVELATKLYNGGDWITMEDYFGITSVYAE